MREVVTEKIFSGEEDLIQISTEDRLWDLVEKMKRLEKYLTEETVNSLNTVQPPYSYQYPYGVFIIVPDRSSEEEFADFFQALPNDLQIVLKYAYEHDIELILLDSDACETSELPTYEW